MPPLPEFAAALCNTMRGYQAAFLAILTCSYVGYLHPPRGFDSNHGNFFFPSSLVSLFFVFNAASFYLALCGMGVSLRATDQEFLLYFQPLAPDRIEASPGSAVGEFGQGQVVYPHGQREPGAPGRLPPTYMFANFFALSSFASLMCAFGCSGIAGIGSFSDTTSVVPVFLCTTTGSTAVILSIGLPLLLPGTLWPSMQKWAEWVEQKYEYVRDAIFT